jgi:hypothetical protein
MTGAFLEWKGWVGCASLGGEPYNNEDSEIFISLAMFNNTLDTKIEIMMN